MSIISKYEIIRTEYIQNKGLDFWEYVKVNYPNQWKDVVPQYIDDIRSLPTKQYPSQDIELWNQIIGDTSFE